MPAMTTVEVSGTSATAMLDEAPIGVKEISVGDLVRRIRVGDEQTAAELVRRYEPAIRQRVRIGLRMQDARLRRVFDSMDVCQSVLASFFVRAAAGQYDVDEPGRLVALLGQRARSKLAPRRRLRWQYHRG